MGRLDDYVEVHVRIKALYEKYPEASIQGEYEFVNVGEQTLLVYKATVYRTPDDRRPAIGFASEPFPGKTNFTRDSEVMNAETSAWGRAIAALGFEVHKSIASANEVRARQGDDNGKPDVATPPQKRAITQRCNALAITDEDKKRLMEWAGGAPLTKAKASKLIELLKDAKDHAEVRPSNTSCPTRVVGSGSELRTQMVTGAFVIQGEPRLLIGPITSASTDPCRPT